MTHREVSPGIFMVTERGPFPRLRPTVNLYVIAGHDGLVLDAGYGNRKTVRLFVKEFRRIERICRDRGETFSVKRILLSHAHPDHFAGLRRIRKELGLSVLLTRQAAAIIRSRRAYRSSYDARWTENALLGRPLLARALLALSAPLSSLAYELLYGTGFIPDPDVVIGERGSIPVNGESWRIFPSPGHSSDHVSLYDPARGVLFAGDNVLEKIITWLGPPRSDPAAYVRSLEEYRALPGLALILGSHGGPVSRPARRINAIIGWRKSRIGDVVSVVRKAGPAGITARGIIETLYRRGGPVLRMMAEGWVLLTLRNLMEEGAIWSFSAKGRVLFRAAESGDVM